MSAVPRSPLPKAWPESAALVALSDEVKSLRVAAIRLRLSTHYKKPSTEGPLPPATLIGCIGAGLVGLGASVTIGGETGAVIDQVPFDPIGALTA